MPASCWQRRFAGYGVLKFAYAIAKRRCSDQIHSANILHRMQSTYLFEAHSAPGFEEASRLQDVSVELPDIDQVVCACRKFQKTKNIESAKHMHAEACSHGLDSYSSVGNHIVQMLAECGCIHDAEQVLRRLDYLNEHSWTALIVGCIDSGQAHHAFNFYKRMKDSDVSPSLYTFMALLKACARLKDAERGAKIHSDIMQNKLERDLYLNNSLIDMYAKSGWLTKAREIFDQLAVRDVVSWTALIAGYAEHGPGREALECFQKMQAERVSPNDLTLVCVLKACGSIGAIDKGREISKEVTEKRLQSNIFLGNSLVDMYAKCGALLEAREMFEKLVTRNIVSWNALIAGYAEHGHMREALKCFKQMRKEGISPDSMSWTSLIAGFAEHGPCQEALNVFDQMQDEGIPCDAVSFASVLKACGNVGSIEKGRELHVEIVCNEYDADRFIGNNLIEMYSKSGSLLEAQKVFSKLAKRDICVWNSMIKAYAINQKGRLAMCCFEDMQKEAVNPDKVTFACLLTACSHTRMVAKGKEYFTMMTDQYSITPNIDHYTSIVDLLARTGHVYDAENFLLKALPYSLHDEGMWIALLTACRLYGKVEVGERCFQQLIKINPESAPPYVLLADIYTSVGKLDAAYKIEELRKQACAKKKPAIATVEVNKEVHEFLGGDTPSQEILDFLESLSLRMDGHGHIPNIGQIVRLMSEEEKSILVHEHAEKIAIAFGLCTTQPGQTIRVTRSMLMYNDFQGTNKDVLSRKQRSEVSLQEFYCECKKTQFVTRCLEDLI